MIKNLSKKILACCLVVCMVLTLCVGAITVSAEEVTYDGTLTIGTAEVDAGAEEATVDFTTLAAKDGVAAAEVNVTLPDGATGISKVELVTEDDNVQVTFGVSEGEPLVALPGENPEDPDGADVSVYEGDVKIVDNVFTYILWVYNYDVDVTTVANTVKITFVGDFDETAPVTAAIEACKDDVDLLNLEVVEGAINVATHTCTPAEAVQENVKPATCYAEGSYDEVVYCSDETCGKEISRTPKTIDKIAHTPATAVVENEVAATCYAKGSYESVVYCSVEACKFEISRTSVPVDKTEHTPATAVVENEVAATCLAAGSYESVVYCSVAECKHEITRTPVTVDALGHNYSYVINSDGTHTATCANDASHVVTEAHTYTDKVCVCGDKDLINANITIKPYIYYGSEIGVMFQLTRDQLASYANYELVIDRKTYVNYMVNDAKTVVIPKAKVLNNTKKNPYYILSGIGMYELGLEVSAYINCYDANGVLVAKSNLWSDSVATVIKQAYPAASDLYKTLIADTLNMSAAAQKYFGELPANANTDLAKEPLVNADDPTYGFVASDYASKSTGDLNAVENPIDYSETSPINTTTHYLMNSLVFGKAIGVTYLLRDSNSVLDLSKFEISVSYTSLYPAGVVTPTEERPLIVQRAGKWIQISFEGVYLYDTNKIVTATIKYDGEEVLTTNYTVDTYCKQNLSSSDANTAALADATAKFGAAARAYFTNQAGYQV